MMNRFQKLVNFLRKSNYFGIPAFNYKSLDGVYRYLVYDED